MDFDNYRGLDHDHRALDLAVDLANSLDVVDGEEYLVDAEAVSGWLADRGIDTPRPIAEADVDALRGLRGQIRSVMEGSVEEAEEALDEVVIACSVRPRVTFSKGVWRLSYVSAEDGVVAGVAAIVVAGLASALSESGRERFGTCSKESCQDVYVDTSKNRSRRYCSDSCSNRANVAAFRARQRGS